MATEQLILQELMDIKQTLGDHSSQLKDIQKTVKNGLSSNVKEIREKLNNHLTVSKLSGERSEEKKGIFRRKQDVRLAVLSLIIALCAMTPGVIALLI